MALVRKAAALAAAPQSPSSETLPPPGIPKTVGDAIDMLQDVRALRMAKEKEAAVIKERESALAEHIRGKLKAAGLESGRGKKATFTITVNEQVKVADWDKFYAYILKTKAWELMQKRVGATAIKERWKAGVQVPGVEKLELPDYSLTKL